MGSFGIVPNSRQTRSRLVTERLDLATRWRLARLKHGHLHPRTRVCIPILPAIQDWLHHKMDMRWLPFRVGPQTDINLVRLRKGLDDLLNPL